MSLYTKLKIILSVALALIISTVTYLYLTSLNEEVTIVVANTDISQRAWIKPEMVKVVKIRESDRQTLAPNAVLDLKEIEYAISKQDISLGKVIDKKSDIIAGSRQALIDAKVIKEDGTINNEYFLSDNRRLVTVRLDSQGSVNNSIKIGDFVDIVYTSSDSSNTFSVDILQHVEVFAVQKTGDNSDSTQNITLSVTPQEAVDIVFAKRSGKIDLVLNTRNGEKELVAPSNLKKIQDQFMNK